MTVAQAGYAPRFAASALAVAHIGPVDFELAPGRCLALSGPSGAGKTRLLRAMADLDDHAGHCSLDGRPASDHDAPAWRRRVTYLAAESAWWADTPAAHLPDEPAQLTTTLAALDIASESLDRPLGQLSSGQRQRLALVRLLAQTPSVLLLDEPTANLDTDNVKRVEKLIADYCRRQRACAVWVGHDIDQLARVSGQWIVLDASGGVEKKNQCANKRQ